MNSSNTDNLAEFSRQLSRLVERVDFRIQQHGLNRHGLHIISSLPEGRRPSRAKDLRRLRQLQSSRLARAKSPLAHKITVLIYQAWTLLP